MTSAMDALRHEGTLALDAPTIEGALRQLWHEAAEATDGPPVAKMRVLNLIVYTEDAESADFADTVVSLLPEHHPCRGIIVQIDPRSHRPLRASISARCLIGPGGARTVCSEVITVTGGGDSRPLLVDALTPLLVADLPVVLWWTGRPRPADPIFRRFGAGLVDRVLLDSAAFRDPAAGLVALSRWREDPRYRATLSDLAWERLRPWRQLLAQTVDGPEARLRLAEVEEVTLAYDGDGAPPEEALLAAGWLAATLGWQPEDSPAPGELTLRARTRPVRIGFLGGGSGPVPDALRAIRLQMAGGEAYSVRATEQSSIGVCAVERPGTATIERMAPLQQGDAVELTVAAMGRMRRDPVYEAALAAAGEIALLGATA